MKFNKNSSQHLQKLLFAIAKKHKKALQQLFDSEAESMMTLARQSLIHEQSAQQVLLKTFVIIWEMRIVILRILALPEAGFTVFYVIKFVSITEKTIKRMPSPLLRSRRLSR